MAKMPWLPFQKVEIDPRTIPTIEDIMKQAIRATGKEIPLEDAKKIHAKEASKKHFQNNLYMVSIEEVPKIPGWVGMIHLSIKRLDKEPVHDWRHFQRIKNEILGEEYEAVELYPAQKRVVDCANQYHLWAISDTSIQFPFGWQHGITDYETDRNDFSKQRGKDE